MDNNRNYIFILQDNSKMKPLLQIIALASCFNLIRAYEFQEVRAEVTDPTIRLFTQYKFILNLGIYPDGTEAPWDSSQITTLDSIIVTFPSQYTNIQSTSCQSLQINNVAITLDYQCNIYQNRIMVRNFLSANTYIEIVKLTIGNIKNPSPAGYSQIFHASIGEHTTARTGRILLQPGEFSTCKATFMDTQGSHQGNLQIYLISQQALPISAQIQLKFPSKWKLDLSETPITFLADQDCSSTQKSNIKCIGSQSGEAIIIVENSILQNSNAIIFTLHNILAPITNQQLDQITISSYKNTGEQYDFCNVYPRGVQPQTIDSIELKPISQPTTNSETDFQLIFEVPDIVDSDMDLFVIDFSTGYSPSFEYQSLSTNVIYQSSTDATLTFKPINRNQQFSLTISKLLTAPSIAPISPFDIRVYRNSLQMMKGEFTLSVKSGTLTNIKFIPTQLKILELSEYTLSFDYAPGITSSSSAIQIALPIQQFTIQSNLEAYMGLTKLTTEIVSLTGNIVKLSNLKTESGTISIRLDKIKNPSRTSPLAIKDIEVRLFYDSVLMDQVAKSAGTDIINLQYEPITGISCSVSSSSSTAGQQSIDLTFSITPSTQLLINDKIRVQFSGITHISRASINDFLTDKCFISSSNLQRCYFPDPSQKVLIVQLNMGINKDENFDLRISQFFNNPVITGNQVGQFIVTVLTNDNYEMLNSPNPIFLPAMTTVDPFPQFSLARSSVTNSQLSTYTFTITQQTQLIPGHNIFVFDFPVQIDLTEASCLSCTKQLTSGSNRITYLFPSTATSINKLEMVIENVRNPSSTKPFRNIKLASYYQLQYKYAESEELDEYEANLQPSQLLVSSIIYSSTIYGQQTSLTFKIGPLAAPMSSAQLSFPGFLNDALNLPECSIINPVLCTFTFNSFVVLEIDLSSYDKGDQVQISILKFKIPLNSLGLADIKISTYTSEQYLVSEGLISKWKVSCQLPCKTCDENGCITCYDNALIAKEKLYSETTLQCLVLCNDNQYENQSQLKCQNCPEGCLRCLALDKCTQCKQNFYFHQDKCLQECPPTFYKDQETRYCYDCTVPCKDCTSTIDCISCIDGFYSYQDRCIGSCPKDITVPNQDDPDNFICDLCASECLTCVDTKQKCTNCHSGQALQGGTCVEQCTVGYKYYGKCINSCISPCQTCETQAINCLTCEAPLFFLDGFCYDECPYKFYEATNRVCLKCSDLSDRFCSDCENQNTCIVCDDGFYLSNKDCLEKASIPDGYVGLNGIVVPCQDDCLTCETIPTRCRSCKTKYYHNSYCLDECPVSHYKQPGVPGGLCVLCKQPCKSCKSQFLCLTCLPGKHIQPGSNICLETCPKGYYPSSINWNCKHCKQQCQQCITFEKCTKCKEEYYFYQNSCLNSCQILYPYYLQDPITRSCKQCQPPCKTCFQSLDICSSCLQNLYFDQDNTCVGQCPSGYIADYDNQICTNCQPPCLICEYNFCSRCSPPYILDGDKCVNQCPGGYHKISTGIQQSLQCTECPSQCVTCLSQTFCLTCNETFLWIDDPSRGKCGEQCPKNRPVIISNRCMPCSEQDCIACYSNDQCYECIQTSILWEGFCYNQCPQGYQYNETLETCQIAPTDIIDNSGPPVGKIVETPFPMIFTACAIYATLVTIPLIAGQLLGKDILIWGLWSWIWGIVETGAFAFTSYAYYCYFIYIGIFSNPFGIILLTIISILLVLNVSTMILNYSLVLLKDSIYLRWRSKAKCRSITIVYISQFFMILNYKSFHLLWSNISHFPRLSSPKIFRFIGVISFFGLLLSLCYAIIAILLILEYDELFFIWLDTLVVSACAVLLSGCALRRPENFFDEEIDGLPLHKRHHSSELLRTPALKGDLLAQNYPKTDKSSGDNDSVSAPESSSRLSIGSIQSLLSPGSKNLSEKPLDSNSILQQKMKKQISLQCSILSSQLTYRNQTNKTKNLECFYEQSGQGNMGSISQSRSWNSEDIDEDEHQQDYDLNQAVFLDANGNLLQIDDVSSNEAVLEENLQTIQIQKINEDVNQNINVSENRNGDLQDKPQEFQNDASVSLNNHSVKFEQIVEQSKMNESQIVEISPLMHTVKLKNRLNNQRPQSSIFAIHSRQQFAVNQSDHLQSYQSRISGVNSLNNLSNINNRSSHSYYNPRNISNHSQFYKNNKSNRELSNDRFDNSVVSGHQGSIQSDREPDSSIVSHHYNNDGSLLEAKLIEQRLRLEYLEELRRKQQERIQLEIEQRKKKEEEQEKIRKEIQLQKQLEEIRRRQEQQERIRKEQEYIRQRQTPQMWQELLSQKYGEVSRSRLSIDPLSSKEINEKQKQEKQQIQSENFSSELSRLIYEGTITEEQANIIKEHSRVRGVTSSKMLLRQLNQGITIEDDYQQEESGGSRYLQTKQLQGAEYKESIIEKQSKNEGNKFQIRRKNIKDGEPKTKVVVVDNKKYKSLKRKASELNKQIKRGQQLRHKIQTQQPTAKNISRVSSMTKLSSVNKLSVPKKQQTIPSQSLSRGKSLSTFKPPKQQYLRSIYMRNDNPFPKRQ